MERRLPPTEGNEMAESASVSPEHFPHPGSVGGRPAIGNVSRVASKVLRDLSVDEPERQALLQSRYQARILIQLASSEAVPHPRLLVFLANHLQGRCPFPTVEEDDVLDILYYVSDDSVSSLREIREFAAAVVDVLDLDETALLSTTIQTIDARRRPSFVHAAGITRPELRLV